MMDKEDKDFNLLSFSRKEKRKTKLDSFDKFTFPDSFVKFTILSRIQKLWRTHDDVTKGNCVTTYRKTEISICT